MYKNLNYLLILFSIIIGLSIYYFYPGYIRDDWGMFQTYGTKGNIIDKFKDISTSLLANRPGLAFINVIFVNLIGDNPKIFFIFNFCVYVFGLFLFRVFLNKILNIKLHLFLPILFFPIMNSTTVFSPLNLLGSNFSFLFYSIASVLLINNYKKNIFIASFITLLFSVSLLTYEISGPLIIYNFFLILFFFKKKNNIQISGIIKLFIPMIFSLVPSQESLRI